MQPLAAGTRAEGYVGCCSGGVLRCWVAAGTSMSWAPPLVCPSSPLVTVVYRPSLLVSTPLFFFVVFVCRVFSPSSPLSLTLCLIAVVSATFICSYIVCFYQGWCVASPAPTPAPAEGTVVLLLLPLLFYGSLCTSSSHRPHSSLGHFNLTRY